MCGRPRLEALALQRRAGLPDPVWATPASGPRQRMAIIARLVGAGTLKLVVGQLTSARPGHVRREGMGRQRDVRSGVLIGVDRPTEKSGGVCACWRVTCWYAAAKATRSPSR